MALKLCDQSFETGEKKERRSDINRDMVVYIYISDFYLRRIINGKLSAWAILIFMETSGSTF